jgi:hypothetical protein
MGIGYVLGCLASLLLWKVDRQDLFYKLNIRIVKIIKSRIILEIFYIALIVIICFLLQQIRLREIYNFFTAFLVIDISNTEKKNLKHREKVRFYDSISIISRSVVCGFIAPLVFIAFLGNTFGIAYILIYNISIADYDLQLFRLLFILLTIIPAVVAELLLYIVYLCRNKRYVVDFKGDYLINLFVRPLLNVDILGAYIESVNFYYLYSSKNTDYIKSYGEYSKKIDEVCIKDYLSIGYGICLVAFILFFLIIK